MLLIHEEPRKIIRTGHISYYGQSYRVTDRYIAQKVLTVPKEETLRIECGKEVIGHYPNRIRCYHHQISPAL